MIATTSSRAMPPRRRLGWVGWLLTASLVLNMLFVGLLLGQNWQRWWRGSLPPSERVVEHVLRNFPPAARDQMRDSLEARLPELQVAVGNLRQARTEMHQIMDTDPLDSTRLTAALADVRERLQVLQTIIGDAMVETASKLPPDARHKLADQKEKRNRRGL